jgi:hypothetical protein
VTEENENDSGIFTLMYAYFIGKTSKYPKSNFDVPFSPVAFRIKIYEDLVAIFSIYNLNSLFF